MGGKNLLLSTVISAAWSWSPLLFLARDLLLDWAPAALRPAYNRARRAERRAGPGGGGETAGGDWSAAGPAVSLPCSGAESRPDPACIAGSRLERTPRHARTGSALQVTQFPAGQHADVLPTSD